MKKFYLTHFALYCKGWYNKSGFNPDDIWNDVSRCVMFDHMSTLEPQYKMNKRDVFSLIHTAGIKLLIDQYGPERAMKQYYNMIHPTETWKVGYMTKDWPGPTLLREKLIKENNLYDYDFDTAILYAIISIVKLTDAKTLGWIEYNDLDDKGTIILPELNAEILSINAAR